MEDFIKRYRIISKNSRQRPTTIKSYIPTPNDNDYRRGYIYRYFIRSSNDKQSPIFEVSSKQYTKYLSDPFYTTTKVRWRILGESNEVRTSNSIAVKLASDKIKKLKLYLPNLLQFYKK